MLMPLEPSRPQLLIHKYPHLTGQRVLVTGAAGSLGERLCQRLLASGISHLTAWDADESRLASLDHLFSRVARHSGIGWTSNVINLQIAASVTALMGEARPHIVFHAAAYKRFETLQHQPAEAICNNVIATEILLSACRRVKAAFFILLSTDKAADPVNVLGASKRLAENLLAEAVRDLPFLRAGSMRLCNLRRSRGSVTELFAAQLKRGLPLTITHADMRRRFISPCRAADYLLRVIPRLRSGEIYFPRRLPAAESILVLARKMAARSPWGTRLEPGPALEFTGLREGERLEEFFTGRLETALPAGPFQCILAPHLGWDRDKLFSLARSRRDDEVLRELQNIFPSMCPRPRCMSA